MDQKKTVFLYRKGAVSFKDLRTINNIEYDSYKEPLIVLGLTSDDNESHQAMKEATDNCTNCNQLSELIHQNIK